MRKKGLQTLEAASSGRNQKLLVLISSFIEIERGWDTCFALAEACIPPSLAQR
jgi:hypothetical protein